MGLLRVSDFAAAGLFVIGQPGAVVAGGRRGEQGIVVGCDVDLAPGIVPVDLQVAGY